MQLTVIVSPKLKMLKKLNTLKTTELLLQQFIFELG